MAAQVFKPHGCDLQAWDAGAFSRCIKGRRLIFFGDSTTRQQFQSLACLLGPVTAHQSGSNYWNESSITGAPTAACFSPQNLLVLGDRCVPWSLLAAGLRHIQCGGAALGVQASALHLLVKLLQ